MRIKFTNCNNRLSSLSAIDAENNNNITANELTSLTLEGNPLLLCADGNNCSVSIFDYKGGNYLTIAAGYWYATGSGRTFAEWANTYGGRLEKNFGSYCMSCDTFTLQAQDNVVLTVTPVAEVPEPQTALMLLAGLLGLGFAGRSKRATDRI